MPTLSKIKVAKPHPQDELLGQMELVLMDVQSASESWNDSDLRFIRLSVLSSNVTAVKEVAKKGVTVNPERITEVIEQLRALVAQLFYNPKYPIEYSVGLKELNTLGVKVVDKCTMFSIEYVELVFPNNVHKIFEKCYGDKMNYCDLNEYEDYIENIEFF